MVKKTKTKKKHKTESPLRTEKKTLRISKEKMSFIADEWRTTLDAIKDAISLIDVEGKIVRCNRAMAAFLGKPFPEILGQKCWKLVYGTSEPIEGCPVVRMKETLKKETMILPIDERVFEVTADPIFDDSGGLSGGVHIISDITDRKRAEEELKKSYKEILSGQNAMINLTEDLMKEIKERKDGEDKIKEYSGHLRRLTSQMSLVEEQERRRIANILHDSIGQNLALSKIKLEEVKELASSEHLSIHFDELQKTIDQAINFVRSLTFEISPPVLYELGFEAAIEWLGEQILKKHNVLFEFRDDNQSKPMSETVKILLFQAMKEFLVNIIKHSKAHKVRVSSQKDENNIRISIEDDGIGFDLADISYKIMESGTFGLFSVRERLILIGGYFEINSVPGQGTQITLIAPLENT